MARLWRTYPFKPIIKSGLVSGTASAIITGTITPSVVETAIVSGGNTIIITLTGDTWVNASFNSERQNIINGLNSGGAETNGWNNVVRALQGVAGVVRTSDSVVTITLDAQATYDITATETITVTVPSTAVVRAQSIVGTPTFSVTASGAVTYAPMRMMLGMGM